MHAAYEAFVKNPPPAQKVESWVAVTGNTLHHVNVYESHMEAEVSDVSPRPRWGSSLTDLVRRVTSWLAGPDENIETSYRSAEAHQLSLFWETHPDWKPVLEPIASIIERSQADDYVDALSALQRRTLLILLMEGCESFFDEHVSLMMSNVVNRLRQLDDTPSLCRIPPHVVRWYVWCRSHSVAPGLYVASYGVEGAEEYVASSDWNELVQKYGSSPRFYCDIVDADALS
jgi:hypothetical protein